MTATVILVCSGHDFLGLPKSFSFSQRLGVCYALNLRASFRGFSAVKPASDGHNERSEMPKVRGNVAEKWVRRTANAGTEYQEGVQNPRQSWQAASTAAAPVQAQAVQEAIRDKRYEKGIARSGDARWQSKAISKGVPRFGPGVQDAQADYQKGFAPYIQVIESTNLPPRGPKGDPKNIQRVAVLAKALNDRKRQGV